MDILPLSGGVVIKAGRTKIAIDTRKSIPGARHVVTHAHADHIGAARQTPSKGTVGTAYLAALRGAYVEPLREFTPVEIGDIEMELVPAGHIPGSAQVFIHNGRDVCVTGDFKLEKDVIELGAETPDADVLVLETTFCAPKYVFPKRKLLYKHILEKVEKTREEGKHIVLFAYEIGKAQELTALLNSKGIVPLVTEKIHKANVLFDLRDIQIGGPGWRNVLREPAVLILPPHYASDILALRMSLGNIVFLRPSGWNPRLPLSSHADYAQTVRMVERVAPEIVITYGQNAVQAAQALKREGFEVTPLTKVVHV